MELAQSNIYYKVRWFWNIVKHGAFLLGVRNRMARIGIDFMPYFWVQEETKLLDPPPFIRDDADGYQIAYFGEQEIVKIQKSIKGIGHKNLLKNLKDGQICIGLKKKSEIVAYMFIQQNHIDFNGRKFKLKPDEAYLKDMYTFESYRGKNIAPYLRFKSYQLLRDRGIDTKYSISEYFNKPTIRFKKKLNSKHITLYLSITLLKKYRWNFKLRSYT